MIATIVMAAALLAGYTVTVAIALAATMVIGAAAPEFVMVEHRVRRRFKAVQDIVWLGSSAVGGFVAALITGQTRTWIVAGLLAAAMIGVLWRNSWESRQRGLAHQILISVACAGGVVIGFVAVLKLKI
jgi:hypothetical protein